MCGASFRTIQRADIMMYPFMILDDETEITHSEMLSDGTVKIIIMVEESNKHISQHKYGFRNQTSLSTYPSVGPYTSICHSQPLQSAHNER